MAFPIYVGKKGKDKYKELYGRDNEKIHSNNPNAPFKQRPTIKLFTPCPSEVTKEQTETETETTLTETSTMIPTTQTEAVSDTESTVTESKTEVLETETLPPTLSSETELISITTTETPNTDVLEISTETEIPNVSTETSTELPTTAETEVTTGEEAITFETEISEGTTTMFQTEKPTFTDTDITETEDITFETEPDTLDLMSNEIKTTIVTNTNGIQCPPRLCKKKTQATPKIITLIKDDSDNENLDLRNAQWNSDYSDLRDSLYL